MTDHDDDVVLAAPPPIGGVPRDLGLMDGDAGAVHVHFDGGRLRQVLPDGTAVPFRDLAAERQVWADRARTAQSARLRELGRRQVPDAGALTIEPNPPAYRRSVESYLAPSRDRFNHGSMLETFLNIDFFLGWVSVVNANRSVEGARVYSSGCGAANTVVAYHAFGARSVVGSEIDEEVVRMGRERTRGLPGADVVRIDPSKPLPFADESFDIIESLDVIEHVEDLAPYAQELGRVLAPGGVAIIAAPNRMYPVEQHCRVRLVPWLPFRLGNALTRLASRMPWATAEQRERWTAVGEVRTANVSWMTIIEMAKIMGTTAVRLHRADHPGWPMHHDPAVVEWLARQRKIGVFAPTRQIVGLLAKPPFAAPD